MSENWPLFKSNFIYGFSGKEGDIFLLSSLKPGLLIILFIHHSIHHFLYLMPFKHLKMSQKRKSPFHPGQASVIQQKMNMSSETIDT